MRPNSSANKSRSQLVTRVLYLWSFLVIVPRVVLPYVSTTNIGTKAIPVGNTRHGKASVDINTPINREDWSASIQAVDMA